MSGSADVWLSVGSTTITVIALAFAAWQTRETRRQSSELQIHTRSLEQVAGFLGRQSKSLELVANSLTTEYKGSFPDYLPYAVEAINSANREVAILVGNPAPAFFSAPDILLDYCQAIERRLQKGVSVTLVCMTEEFRRQRLAAQFPTNVRAWNTWAPANADLISRLLEHRLPVDDLKSLDHSRFIDELIEIQNEILHERFIHHGARVLEVGQPVPLQTWIVDERIAVFGIQTMRTALTHGLQTSDPLFVGALRSMFDLYANDESSRRTEGAVR